MKIFKKIASLMPMGLKNYIKYFVYNSESIEKYRRERKSVPNRKAQEIHYSNPSRIISVQGFGYSGSGAVVDLLREYGNCCVWGGYESEYWGQPGMMPATTRSVEIDILRLSGGLFELEKFIGSDNFFLADAAVKRFIDFIDYFCSHEHKGSIFRSSAFKDMLCEFLDHIIDQQIDTGKEYPYNYHQQHDFFKKNNQIYFLKKMSVRQFRSIGANLLKGIFSLGNTTGNLVLDQLFMDGELDSVRNHEYIPNHKIIMVYRDPRDVYMIGVNKKISWIPTGNSSEFIKWYTRNVEIIKGVSSYEDAMVVGFEKLVYAYDETVDMIQTFVGLDAADHLRKKVFFDPNISKANIGLWKSLSGTDRSIISDIGDKLSEYCFD